MEHPLDNATRQSVILDGLQQQIGWCRSLGSPFTAELLSHLADDFVAEGQTARLIGGWPGDPTADALPLRLVGALHALALDGSQPELTAVYPPHQATPDEIWQVVKPVLSQREAFIRAFLTSPPQTNEVGRSGVLLGGFLCIADATGLPLRTLEIGASAGLNLIWDQYRYTIGPGQWGDPASPVHLEPEWTGPLPPLSQAPIVTQRAACDIAPIDISDAGQRLRLQAYVWPDQLDRLARLVAAISLARKAGHWVAKADAATWLQDQLASPKPGQITVLYHSIMWQYMPEATQSAITALMQAAGGRATREAPLAWLRFEPPSGGGKPELRLMMWPGGEQRLAVAHPHGRTVTWLS
jgi:hypothetical protein